MKVIEDTCSACGERNPAGSQFCLFCGAFLGWEQRPVDAGRATSSSGISTGSPVTAVGSTSSRGVVSEPTEALDVQRQATAALPVVTPGTTTAPPGLDCPECHTANEAARRFCRRCGHTLHLAAATPSTGVRPLSWWRRLWNRVGRPEERAARRAYRRSLPGLYRWRRRLLVLLALVVVAGALTLVGRNPARLVLNAWHDVRGDVVQVEGVTLSTVLPRGVTERTPAAAAADGDSTTAWTTSWSPPKTAAGCGDTPGTAGLRITFPENRIREIRLVSGVTDPSKRTLELLPRTLHVAASDGSCLTAEVGRSVTSQTVTLDTGVPVTSLTITVAATYAPTDAGQRTQPLVSLSEVSLWSRPL